MSPLRQTLAPLRAVLGLPVLAVLATVSSGACGGEGEPGGASLALVYTTAPELDDRGVSRVAVTAPGQVGAIELTRRGPRWEGTLDELPAASAQTIRAKAFDASGGLLAELASESLPVASRQRGFLNIAMFLAPPVNRPPEITSFAASATSVVTEDVVLVSATATDPDPGDSLTALWTATCGSFANPTALATQWLAPTTTGNCKLKLQVTDTRGRTAASSVTIQVAIARSSAAVTAEFNTWPIVSGMTASPSRIDVGETTQVAVDAFDPDGDALGFSWSSSCAGTFDAPSLPAPRFTLLSRPANGTCALVVTVTDPRGGANRGTLSIAGAAFSPKVPPIIDQSYQSSTAPRPGERVTFRVRAHDHYGQAVRFQPAASAGSLTVRSTTSDTIELEWVPPCDVVHATVTVTVLDPDNQSSVQKFDADVGGTVLATGLPNPDQLASFGSTLYVTTRGDNALRTFSTSGAPIAIRKPEPVTDMVADATALYFTSASNRQVTRLAHGSTTPSVLWTAPSAATRPSAIAWSPTSLVFAGGKTVYTIAPTGGAATPIGLTSSGVDGLAVAGTNVYATDRAAGQLHRFIPGSTAGPTTALVGPTSVAVALGFVFVETTSMLARVPAAGGTPTSWASPGRSVVSDGTFVYASTSTGIARGTIGVMDTNLACLTETIAEIAVDDTSVYATLPNSNRMVKIPK